MIIQFPTINSGNIAVNTPFLNLPYESDPKIIWFDKAAEKLRQRQVVDNDDCDDIA